MNETTFSWLEYSERQKLTKLFPIGVVVLYGGYCSIVRRTGVRAAAPTHVAGKTPFAVAPACNAGHLQAI